MAKDSTIKKGYKQTEIGVIPEDWEVKEMDAFTICIASGKSNTICELGDYPIYGSTGIIGYRKKSDYSGDKVLIARVGANAGKVNKVKGKYCVSDNTLIVTYQDNIDINFSYYQLINFKLNRLVFGSGQPLVTGSQIKKIVCPIPKFKSEQTAIAEVLSDTDALIENLENQIAKKKAIKQGTMQQLLTGKKRLPGFSGEWEVKKLGEIFQFLSTANNPRADLSIAGDIGYIHYGDIHTNTSVFLNCEQSNLPTIEENRITGIPLVEEGDLVMADASEDYAGIGKCMEVQNVKGRKIIAGLHTFLLRGNPGFLASGFKGYLQFIPEIKASLVRFATGISVYGVSKSNVKSIEARIPAIQEQTAITEILSDMDSEIEVLEKKCKKYKQIKQGMMQQLLTGKIRLV